MRDNRIAPFVHRVARIHGVRAERKEPDKSRAAEQRHKRDKRAFDKQIQNALYVLSRAEIARTHKEIRQLIRPMPVNEVEREPLARSPEPHECPADSFRQLAKERANTVPQPDEPRAYAFHKFDKRIVRKFLFHTFTSLPQRTHPFYPICVPHIVRF